MGGVPLVDAGGLRVGGRLVLGGLGGEGIGFLLGALGLLALAAEEPEAAHAAAAGEELLGAEGRVEDVEDEDGDDDEDALEGDEELLVGHELAVPALAQLGDTEDGTPEDEEGGEAEGAEEGLEAEAGAHGAEGRVLGEDGLAVLLVAAAEAEGEVGGGDDEAQDGGNLEGQAGDHDVGA